MDKRALVIRFSSLGDVVLASCVIDPLKSMGYTPYLLTFEPYGDVFEDDRRVFVIQTKREELFKENTLKKLRGFDLYLDLHKNLRTVLLRLILGGDWRTYKKDTLRRRLAVYFESFRKPYSVVNAYLRAIGYEDGKPKIEVSEKRLGFWRERLGDDFLCVGPGARYTKKRYPHFDALVELLVREGCKVVLVGDKRDRALTEGWNCINLCGELSLVDTLAVIKLSRVFVGNDSGLLHMARAVGTKAVQIYGGTHPTFGFSLSKDEGQVLLKGLRCQPCDPHGKGECKWGTYECLNIEPAVVKDKVLRLAFQGGY